METMESPTVTQTSIESKPESPHPNQSRGFWSSITTDDRWDFDPIIISILTAVACSIFLQFYSVFHKNQDFDAEKFGNGIAFILGAGGVGYGAKRFGEKHKGEKDGSADCN